MRLPQLPIFAIAIGQEQGKRDTEITAAGT